MGLRAGTTRAPDAGTATTTPDTNAGAMRSISPPPRGPGPGKGPGGQGRGPGAGPRHPDGGNGHGRGGYRSRGTRLSEKQEAELLKHLKKHRPDIYERLAELRQKGDRTYRQWLCRLWDSYQELMKLPDALRKHIYAKEAARRNKYHLLRAIRNARPDDKTRLVNELRKAVTVEFEAEQAEREYRLELLAREIERVRAEIKARRAQCEKIISERIEKLMEMSSRIGRGWPKPKPKPKPGKDQKPPSRPE